MRTHAEKSGSSQDHASTKSQHAQHHGPKPGLASQHQAGNQAVQRRLQSESASRADTQTGFEAALRSPGARLDPESRSLMERSFGTELGDVTVHTDRQAAESAEQLGARAYTYGQQIVFGEGLYNPGTGEGRRLLAHEVAHTIQQRGATTHAPPFGAGSGAAGSGLESAAASAGLAVAAGRKVTHPLGTSGLAIARDPIGQCTVDPEQVKEALERQLIGNENLWVPEHLHDAAKVAEFASLWERLSRHGRYGRRFEYPERVKDLGRLLVLKSEATLAKDERAAAVAEATSVIASMDVDEEFEEAQAELLRIAEKAPEPLFLPGGFPDEAIYAATDEANERMDMELAHARDPRPFEVRLEEARKQGPVFAWPSERNEAIWQIGLREGLFAENERRIVFHVLEEPMRAKWEQERTDFEIKAYNDQINRFREFRSQLNLGFIQGALLGRPGVPVLIRGAYTTYGFAHTGVELYRGIQSGDPTRVVGAALPLASGIALHRMLGVGKPPPSRGAPGPGGRASGPPQEVFEYEVRTMHNAEPATVKHITSNSWAQYVWEMDGGRGIHPVAWRPAGSTVVRVNDMRWPGKLSEISQPGDVVGIPAPASTAAPRGPQVGPSSRSSSLGSTGQTNPSLARPVEVDALADTGPMRPPLPPRQLVPGGRRQVIEATADEAIAAYQANPRSVMASPNSNYHVSMWENSGGEGAAPIIFRSVDTVLVDIQLAPLSLRSQLGMGMRLP